MVSFVQMHVVNLLLPPAPLVLFHELAHDFVVWHEDRVVKAQLLLEAELVEALAFETDQSSALRNHRQFAIVVFVALGRFESGKISKEKICSSEPCHDEIASNKSTYAGTDRIVCQRRKSLLLVSFWYFVQAFFELAVFCQIYDSENICRASISG